MVPKFAELFESLDAKLPTITLFMLAVGQNAQKYFPFLIGGLVLAGFIFWQWKKTDRGADQIDRVILSLPLLGGIRLKHQVATFSRMLSTLLQGGLPLVPSMETVRQFHVKPADFKGCDAGEHARAGRARTGWQPGRAEYFSGPGSGNDRSRRVDGSFAGDVEFSSGIL